MRAFIFVFIKGIHRQIRGEAHEWLGWVTAVIRLINNIN